MKELTAKQQEIFDYLVQSVSENSYVPTLREIAAHFAFRSVNAVNDHLAALEKKGYLTRRANSSRVGRALLTKWGAAADAAPACV